MDNVVSVLNLDSNSFEIFDLEPFTTYEVSVQARTRTSDNNGYGALSEPVTHRTAEGVPETVQEVTFRTRNTSCLQIEWVPTHTPNGVIQEYRVSIASKNSNKYFD